MGQIDILLNWDEVIEKWNPRQTDVYWSESYVRLYSNQATVAECFRFRRGESELLLPYLKMPILHDGKIYYDAETAYGYGGPISNNSSAIFLAEAARALKDFWEENQFFCAFLRYHPLFSNHTYLESAYPATLETQTVTMDLRPGVEQIWAEQIHSKHRNVIRKAQDNGLVVEFDHELRAIDEFERLYNLTMDRLEAKESYYFPSDYFANIRKNLPGKAFLSLVKDAGQIISAALFFYHGPYGHYHLAGSDSTKMELYPNNLMIYRTALHLKELGVEFFHLGGGKGGLFDFKKRFSDHRSDYYLGKIVINQEIYQSINRAWEMANPTKSQTFANFHMKYRC